MDRLVRIVQYMHLAVVELQRLEDRMLGMVEVGLLYNIQQELI